MTDFDIDILINDTLNLPQNLPQLLAQTISATLQQEHIHPPTALSLLLTTSERLHTLNRDFLGFDKPTDVLSFPAGEPMPGMVAKDGSGYLGDIAIAITIAQTQATQAGHTLEAECQLLAIHGTLHLLGYDHADPDQKAAMWQAQQKTLNTLAIKVTVPE